MRQSEPHIVAFAVHDAYAGPAAVAATSIMANSPAHFNFFILDLGLTDQSKYQIEKAAGKSRVTFASLPGEMSLDGLALSDLDHAKRLGREMYAKFYLPELLLRHCDRFVYLDSDTLTVGDLSPLFSLQLHPFAVGGVPCFCQPRVDSAEGVPDFRELGLAPATPCLDTGVLIIDTVAFTERAIGRRALEYGRSRSRLPLGDLTAMCAVLRGEWQPLGFEWNFQVYEQLRKSYEGPIPVIYHFSGRHKPFLLGSRFPDAQIMYDEYRRQCIAAGGPPF